MPTTKEAVTLSDNLAAVKLSTTDTTGDIAGVITVIPEGETVQHHKTASQREAMEEIDWHGAAYEVFAEDLRERGKRCKPRRENNPGIVPISDRHQL